MRFLSFRLLVLGFALTVLGANRAEATAYGDFVDPSGTIAFLDVRDELGLFGTGYASVDSLDFTPRAFELQCSACPDGVTASDSLDLDVQARGEQRIALLEIREALDFSLQSFDPDGFAAIRALSTIRITITEIDGRPVDLPSAFFDVAFSGSSLQAVIGPATTHAMLIGTTGLVDLDSLVRAAGEDGTPTRLRMQMSTQLAAFAEGSGSAARLQLGDADWTMWTIGPSRPIPEPSTSLLLILGLAGLGGRQRSGRLRPPRDVLRARP